MRKYPRTEEHEVLSGKAKHGGCKKTHSRALNGRNADAFKGGEMVGLGLLLAALNKI